MVNIADSTNTPEFYEWQRIKKIEGSKAGHQYYLRSVHWKNARNTILARDGHTCKLCGIHASKTKEKSLHIHHQTYARLWKERQQDLISLCNPCHTEIHKAGGTLKVRKYKKAYVKRNTTFTPKARQVRIQNAAHSMPKKVRFEFYKEIVNGQRQMPSCRPERFPKKEWKWFKQQYEKHKKTEPVKQTTRRRPAEQ